ncbi:hypothetical protein JHK85_000618 [Glycine max]|nr:hypothetical protein JHK85_000618 [Glycine max]KAG5087990.1 hypothetical protein JHK86_000602 [Glycine max]
MKNISTTFQGKENGPPPQWIEPKVNVSRTIYGHPFQRLSNKKTIRLGGTRTMEVMITAGKTVPKLQNKLVEDEENVSMYRQNPQDADDESEVVVVSVDWDGESELMVVSVWVDWDHECFLLLGGSSVFSRVTNGAWM